MAAWLGLLQDFRCCKSNVVQGGQDASIYEVEYTAKHQMPVEIVRLALGLLHVGQNTSREVLRLIKTLRDDPRYRFVFVDPGVVATVYAVCGDRHVQVPGRLLQFRLKTKNALAAATTNNVPRKGDLQLAINDAAPWQSPTTTATEKHVRVQHGKRVHTKDII